MVNSSNMFQSPLKSSQRKPLSLACFSSFLTSIDRSFSQQRRCKLAFPPHSSLFKQSPPLSPTPPPVQPRSSTLKNQGLHLSLYTCIYVQQRNSNVYYDSIFSVLTETQHDTPTHTQTARNTNPSRNSSRRNSSHIHPRSNFQQQKHPKLRNRESR